MNDFQMAASDLRKLGAFLQGVVSIAPKLEEAGSIEQAINEARLRLDAANAEEVELAAKRQQYLKAHEEQLAAKRAESDAYVARQKADGLLIRDQTTKDVAAIMEARNKDVESVQTILRQLNDRRASLAQECRAMADQIAAAQEINNRHAALSKQCDAMSMAIKTLEQTRDKLDADLGERQNRYDTMVKKHADFLASAGVR